MFKKLGIFAMSMAMTLAASGAWAGSGCTASKEVANKSADCAMKCSGKGLVGGDYDNKMGTCPVAGKEKMAACAASCGDKAAKQVVGGDYDNKAASCTATCGDKEAKQMVGGDYEKKVVNTETAAKSSPFYQLGDKIQDATLMHAQSGEQKKLSDLAGKNGTVLIFWNQNCPWCEGPRGSADRISAFTKKYQEKGVSTLLIDAGVDKEVKEIVDYSKKQVFPVLVNRDSSLAAKFNASYTPEVFILDKDMKLVYRGAFDVKRGDNVANYAEQALQDVLDGRTPAVQEARGTGCTIKWAPGARPET